LIFSQASVLLERKHCTRAEKNPILSLPSEDVGQGDVIFTPSAYTSLVEFQTKRTNSLMEVSVWSEGFNYRGRNQLMIICLCRFYPDTE